MLLSSEIFVRESEHYSIVYNVTVNGKRTSKVYENIDNYNNLKLRANGEDLIQKFYDKVFYKERWIKEDGIEQRLIITYSPKYQEYQKNIREKQIQRANNIIEKNPKTIKTRNENDPKRFINNIPTTDTGEVALNNNYYINQDKILEEARYDGLYAVCTLSLIHI